MHIQAGRELFLEEMRDLRVDVSRETRDQLEALVYTLGRWQKAINLVGKTTLAEVWTRHILDSAQLLPLIPKDAKTLVDLGSGGGFPGLVLAALRPDLAVTLIESDARKCAFLGEAGAPYGLEQPAEGRRQPDRSLHPRSRPISLPPERSLRSASCWLGQLRTVPTPVFAFSTRARAGKPS